jgi:hypothetical protein
LELFEFDSQGLLWPFFATLRHKNPHLALLNFGFCSLIGKKMVHNPFPEPNPNSFLDSLKFKNTHT